MLIYLILQTINLSAEKLLSSFVMILLFSLFMFIFGLIIHLISSAVKIVPLGEKLDKAIGFISGVVKGLIVAIIVYFILYTVNMIPNVHIPPDNTVLNNVMQMIGGF
ncbi:CvpA family protein [Hominilimicola sp.]|uniref:CvpA family protein n=1 Tax=Hominilimicola sp. TaxID=3073571 RepID=UPI00399A9163